MKWDLFVLNRILTDTEHQICITRNDLKGIYTGTYQVFPLLNGGQAEKKIGLHLCMF